jgi:hypothetical protein
VCHSAEKQTAAIDLLRRAVESGRVGEARIAEAAARLERLLRFAGGPPELHRVERRLAEAKRVEVAVRALSSGAGRDPTAA